jgi:hypothetical protein
MDRLTPTKRRWFRFSLRTMFVLVTVFCVWLGYELNQIHSRKSLIAKIRAAGGKVSYYDRQSWRSRYLGDGEPVAIYFQEGFGESHYELLVQARQYFPDIGFIEMWKGENEGGSRTYGGKGGEFLVKIP